ncbi:argininosuccinate lyase [Paracoccus aestuarii]|uniref:Argininosuccinate lyase n=1 Tax=Paracoccus aestuarii TaxID=453842 RepID=A0A418ZU96_9RHOB|nr:argininosuccinate lyase [Paracoccus aestuarii]RJL02817.1 argininosuccinate lyase [Paracoccus aestuarii]WCQ98861.1 argininosuccinate lyase [Paracoccus aestuarii]
MRNIVIIVAIVVVAALVLSGCGVDGPPERPEPRLQQQIGISIGGDARIGVAANL